LKDIFLFVIPIAIVMHWLTIGYWTLEYNDAGEMFICEDVLGFPFPSRGNFWGVQFYNSGDQAFSLNNMLINCSITFLVSIIIYFLFLRKFNATKIFIISMIFPLYLLGAFAAVAYFGIIGSNYPWVSDFKIISYHLWNF